MLTNIEIVINQTEKKQQNLLMVYILFIFSPH